MSDVKARAQASRAVSIPPPPTIAPLPEVTEESEQSHVESFYEGAEPPAPPPPAPRDSLLPGQRMAARSPAPGDRTELPPVPNDNLLPGQRLALNSPGPSERAALPPQVPNDNLLPGQRLAMMSTSDRAEPSRDNLLPGQRLALKSSVSSERAEPPPPAPKESLLPGQRLGSLSPASDRAEPPLPAPRDDLLPGQRLALMSPVTSGAVELPPDPPELAVVPPPPRPQFTLNEEQPAMTSQLHSDARRPSEAKKYKYTQVVLQNEEGGQAKEETNHDPDNASQLQPRKKKSFSYIQVTFPQKDPTPAARSEAVSAPTVDRAAKPHRPTGATSPPTLPKPSHTPKLIKQQAPAASKKAWNEQKKDSDSDNAEDYEDMVPGARPEKVVDEQMYEFMAKSPRASPEPPVPAARHQSRFSVGLKSKLKFGQRQEAAVAPKRGGAMLANKFTTGSRDNFDSQRGRPQQAGIASERQASDAYIEEEEEEEEYVDTGRPGDMPSGPGIMEDEYVEHEGIMEEQYTGMDGLIIDDEYVEAQPRPPRRTDSEYLQPVDFNAPRVSAPAPDERTKSSTRFSLFGRKGKKTPFSDSHEQRSKPSKKKEERPLPAPSEDLYDQVMHADDDDGLYATA